MKKQIIIGSLVALTGIANAQWSGTNPLTTASKVRIGSTTAPNETLHLGDATTGSLHWGTNGMLIKFANSGGNDRALLELHSPDGANRMVFQSLSSATYFGSLDAQPLIIQNLGGNVGINTNFPGQKLDIAVSGLNDGININQSGTSSAALHLTNSYTNGNHWGLFSTGSGNSQGAGNFSIYDYGNNVDRLFIKQSTGNVGIGTITPSNKLEIVTTTFNDGINVIQNGAGASALHLTNNDTYGRHWALLSNGNGNTTTGSGQFSIYDYNSGQNRFIINGSTGNVLIGTSTYETYVSKLHVTKDINPGTTVESMSGYFEGTLINGFSSTGSFAAGVRGNITAANASYFGNGVGVMGEAHTGTGYYNKGLDGTATGGNDAYGGFGNGGQTSSTGNAYGFSGQAHAVNGNAFGIEGYGSATGSGVSAAGMFYGDIYVSGSYNPSDEKLKENIKPMENAISKINLLKPKTYTYKTKEYKTMHFTEGQQMGFLAKELENVFPELIKEMKNISTPDTNNKRVQVGDFKAINYVGLIPVLISGIQEQQVQMENMQKQMDEQKQLITNLTNQLNNKNAGVTGINEIKGADGFAMEQNIPNPFSTETVIKYTLTNQTKTASLIVYDLSGKQINSFALESGSSSITINSEKLAAGIYIYSIMADGKIMDSKRMVVSQK